MKKCLCALLALSVLCLCGCTETLPEATREQTQPIQTEPSVQETTLLTQPTEPAPTEPAPTEPAPTEPAPTEPLPTEPTKPLHSELYLEGVSQEQMLTYFEEVVLNIEYTTSQTGILRKWTDPITYRIVGEATQEDLRVLDDLFTQLNEVPGFPGIHPAEEGNFPGLMLYFQARDEFRLAFSQVVGGEEADGAVQFWFFNDTNNIYKGNIGYRTDIDQATRSSVLVEEIINLLGITDTVLRPDSITYQYGSEVTQLSDVDWVILKMLYHPAMECGMDKDACAAVLAELYY